MRKTLEQLLNKIGITSEIVEQARQRQTEQGGYLRENLIALGAFTEETFAQSVAEHLRVPYITLENQTISEKLLKLVPRETAEKYVAIPFELDERHRRLSIAMADPSDMSTIDDLKFIVGYTLIPHYAPEDELLERIHQEYSRFEDKQVVAAAWATQPDISEDQGRVIDLVSLTTAEASIPRLAGTIFSVAYIKGASTIHITPRVDGVHLCLRIHGTNCEIARFPRKLASSLISKMKRLFGVETGEHPRLYYKGYTTLKLKNNKILDLSYLIYPSRQGEELLIKIKDRTALPSLQDLAFEPRALDILQSAFHRLHGTVLVTGTARSGVTTTLYSLLHSVNDPQLNIHSIEDPIECKIDGVIQGQISSDARYSYDQYMHSVFTQRPDILMVDQICEAEMVQPLLQFSSGTLVLSSLPAVDTASATVKLVLMSNSRVVADYISCMTSQRLVRRICDSCKEKISLAGAYREKLGLLSEDECYAGKGCEQCDYTGYYGVVPIFEIMPFTSELRRAVIESCHVKELRHLMAEQGFSSLRDEGMKKVKQGITTVQEVLRATML